MSFDQEFLQPPGHSASQPDDAPLSEPLLGELRRHNLLQPLIQRRVLRELAAPVVLPQETADGAWQQYLQQNGLRDEAALEEHLSALGIDRQDLRWQVELALRLTAVAGERFGPKAEARFLVRKNQLDRVVYSLLRVRDGCLARELYLRLDAGEASFSDLAAGYSEGPERQTNGIVGPVPLTQAHPQLSERLRTSKAGELMEPFAIAEWWLVARLESYAPAVFDAAMANQMSSELLDDWVQQETRNRLRLLSSKHLTNTIAPGVTLQ
jgi:parvulin-like peptidyl-prolyl isomerase